MEEALGAELVEEILLRLLPGDPVSLLRAATVCRRWCRIISAPGFHRRFGQRHRTAPMLGFVANLRDGDEDDRFDYAARFVPATPFLPRRSEHRDRRALDSRHGRVLLTSRPWGPELEVWDPVTDELWELPDLPLLRSPFTWNAAVVCADYGACDHLDCRRGPFLVVFLDADGAKMRVHLYLSKDCAWSEPSYGPPSPKYGIERVPTALVGNALYFLIDASNSILKYNLATRNVSVIHLPPDFISDFAALTMTGDGGLGFARVEKSRLWVCSMETDSKGDEFWVPVRSIELQTLLGVDAYSIINDCVAFAHGVEVFFVGTEDGWFSIDLKSGRVREEEYGDGWTHGVVPYTSFYTPDLHQYGVVPV